MHAAKILRICILAHWILILISIWLSLSLETHLPTALREWVIADSEIAITHGKMIVLIAMVFMLLASIVASIALFLLKKWGAWLFLFALVIGYICYPFTGPVVAHPIADTIDELTVLISGVIIGLAFFSGSIKKPGPANVADRRWSVGLPSGHGKSDRPG